MIVLPVAERELRVLSRKPSLYWNRIGLVVVALFLCGTFFITAFLLPTPQLSTAMFTTLTVLAFIYCLFAGIRTTSDCLSEERRNETLGLLFLTPLRGWDVVSGKMVANSIQSVYAILAVFPVIAISLMLGGVGLFEFCRVVITLLVTLFLSLSTGVFVSSRSQSAVRSGVATFLLMFLFCALGFLVLIILEAMGLHRFSRGDTPLMLLFHSPCTAIALSYDANYNSPGSYFYWLSIGFNFVLSCVLLALATRQVRKIWQKKDSHLEQPAFKNLSKSAKKTKVFSRPVPDGENPIFWKQTRNRSKPMIVLACFVGFFTTILIINIRNLFGPSSLDIIGFFAFIFFLAQIFLKIWLAIEAASRFGEDRKSGALGLLLCTPLRVREILNGHTRSLFWQFQLPVLLTLLFGLIIGFRFEFWQFFGTRISDSNQVLYSVMYLILFLLDLGALSYFGMWRGLNSRFVSRAVLVNLLCVLVLPWFLFWQSISFWAVLFPSWFTTGKPLIIICFALNAGSSLFWWSWGRTRLKHSLREIVALPAGMSRAKLVEFHPPSKSKKQ